MDLVQENIKTISFEARKWRLSENTDTTWRLSLDIHPDDIVKSGLIHVTRGQRFMVVMAQIDDDEELVPEHKAAVSHTKTLAEKVHIACKNTKFQKFLSVNSESEALNKLRIQFAVKSLSECTEYHNQMWRELVYKYDSWLKNG